MSRTLVNAPKYSPKTEGKLLKLNRYRADVKELERFMKSYGRLRNLEMLSKNNGGKTAAVKREVEREKIRLCKKVHQLLVQTRIIDTAIDALADGTQALLLRYRYIDGYSWERITEELCYSKRNVYYMHLKALEALKI